MSKGLTLEQMEFLLSKGLTGEDMVTFAKLGSARSKGAERVAKWRAERKTREEGSVTKSVTCNALHPPIEDHNPPISPSGENKKRGSHRFTGKPEDVTEPVWRDFSTLRRSMKAPVSETALSGIRREAERAGWSMDAALAECVARGWRGFKADWVKPETPKSVGPPGNMLNLILAKA